MGNALDAAKFSIEKGNTGVGTKKELLAGIDRGIQGVKTWKSNIDQQRLDLKTNTAEKYRQAELKTMENLPSDKTSRDLALKALSNYKDRLYGNMGLVQAGMVKPEDNLIFQENGKQSFDILAQQINGYAKEKENYIKRLKGYYELDENGNKKIGNDGLPIYIEPTSGAVDQSLQDLHDRMGNPDFTDMTFAENGMGRITFYQTKIDETTKTRVLDLDGDGNPQPYEGIQDMSVLAFNNKRNQTADKFNLEKETGRVIGEGSPLGQAYEKMRKIGKMNGVVVDDLRQLPQLEVLLDDAAATATATVDRQASILSDNGPDSQKSMTLNEFQVKELEKQGIDLDEKIDYTYIDTDPSSKTYGKELSGKKSKYIKMVTAKNNQIVPVLDAEDKLASERIAKTSFYSALKRDITDGGTKDQQFQRSAASYGNAQENKNKVGRVEFSKRLALGGEQADKALEEMNQSGLYTLEKGYNQILSKSKVKNVTIDGSERKAEVYRVQTPSGPKDTYVYHTEKDGTPIPLQERTRQTLAIMMTNPTETKDLFDTYINQGNNFKETYNEANFNQKDNVSTVNVRLNLDSTVSGTGSNKTTLKESIDSVVEAAIDDEVGFGFTPTILASGLQENVTQALLNNGQQLKSSPTVSYDEDNQLMTITAVNSKGKTIAITKTMDFDSTSDAKKSGAMVTEFLSNINSDENYISGPGKFD